MHWSTILPNGDHRSKFINETCSIFINGALFNNLTEVSKKYFIYNLKAVLRVLVENWQEVKKMKRDSITAGVLMKTCKKSGTSLKTLVDTFKPLENYDIIFNKPISIRKSKAYISLESWMA